ncbi:hypothetical protein PUNSTDRAFT_138636, partial [Punctularia strigosozonata HHB-11173 SS5]
CAERDRVGGSRCWAKEGTGSTSTSSSPSSRTMRVSASSPTSSVNTSTLSFEGTTSSSLPGVGGGVNVDAQASSSTSRSRKDVGRSLGGRGNKAQGGAQRPRSVCCSSLSEYEHVDDRGASASGAGEISRDARSSSSRASVASGERDISRRGLRGSGVAGARCARAFPQA